MFPHGLPSPKVAFAKDNTIASALLRLGCQRQRRRAKADRGYGNAGSCTRPMVRSEAGAPYGVHLVNGGKRDGARFEPLLLVPKIGVEPIRP